jgi:hypothetical protein
MLHRPWFTPIVVVFWCLSSGWLLVEKILPSLSPGAPPGYQAIYTSEAGLVPVAWTVLWNDRPLGWAVTEGRRTGSGGLLVDSLLHFDRLPLDEIVPAWTSVFVRRALPKEGGLVLDARGRVVIDDKGALRSFTSVVQVPGGNERVLLNGTVAEGAVRVTVQAGDMRYETTRHLPEDMMIGDELSPQATMPGLYEGRRWTVPVYSPLRAGGSLIEILHAEVGREESISWGGPLVRVHPVVYREDPARHHAPRCRLWVDRAGRVLRQEAAILGSRIAFVRQTDEEAVALAATLTGQDGPRNHAPLAEGASAP